MLCQMTLCLAEQFKRIVSFGIMTKINGIFNKGVKAHNLCKAKHATNFCVINKKEIGIMLLRDKLEFDSQRQNIML